MIVVSARKSNHTPDPACFLSLLFSKPMGFIKQPENKIRYFLKNSLKYIMKTFCVLKICEVLFTGFELHETMMEVNIFDTKWNVFSACFCSWNFNQGVS